MLFDEAVNEAERKLRHYGSADKAFDQLKLGFSAEALAAELERSQTGKRLADHMADVANVMFTAATIAVHADRGARESLFPDRRVPANQMTLPGMPRGVERFGQLGEMLRTARTTPHWKQLRIAAFIRAQGKCERCRHAFAAHLLQLHHLTYVRLGNESLADVELLCEDCHRKQHKR